MVAIERPAYPRMKRAPNAKELAGWYTPTQKEREQAAATCRGKQSILSFLVLYKVLQRLGYFPSPGDIPAVIDNSPFFHDSINFPSGSVFSCGALTCWKMHR